MIIRAKTKSKKRTKYVYPPKNLNVRLSATSTKALKGFILYAARSTRTKEKRRVYGPVCTGPVSVPSSGRCTKRYLGRLSTTVCLSIVVNICLLIVSGPYALHKSASKSQHSALVFRVVFSTVSTLKEGCKEGCLPPASSVNLKMCV